jgi:hypothetical protein
VASKAAAESKPEAYPLGYVEDFDDARTPLAACFNILRLSDQATIAPPASLTPHRIVTTMGQMKRDM